ncbi:hypothetical protein L9F63_009379 [Diploptera punctata]|uniref:Odorant receptor n=1 Tax=Diploptera punctata TaxID=6984 RepID=A0AAD8AJG7_DIPPU|nr:hypothetical protein L9F63_009379 [Diploptera punctata]
MSATIQLFPKLLPEGLRKRSAFTMILSILHLGGMLVDTSENTNLRILIFNVLGKCFTIACLIIVSVGFLVETIKELGNFEEFAECLKYLLKQSRNVIKVGTVLVQKNKILDLIKTVEESFYVHDKDLTVEETTIVRKCMDNARRFSFIYLFQWFCTLVLESSIKEEIHEMETQNFTNENLRKMPIKLWVPFPTENTPFYQIGVVYNVLFVISGSWFSAVTDTLIFTFLFYMTSQFEILGCSIKNMRKDRIGEIHLKQEENIELLTQWQRENLNQDSDYLMTSSSGYNREMENYLASCVVYHQQLLQNVEVLKTIMSPIEAVEVLTASILIALSGFNLILSDDTANMVRNATFLIYIILGLGMHCWLAGRLTTQSVQVYYDAYSSLWYIQTTSIKKSISMIIMRAQKPVVLNAGPFFSLSLETFGKIMQTSYSYLTLLTQVNEEE